MSRRKSPPPRRLSLLLLLLVSILIWVGSNPDLAKDSPTPSISKSAKPSSYVENAEIITYEGIDNTRLSINSQRAEFYDDNNIVLLTAPKIRLAGQSKQSESSSTSNGKVNDQEYMLLSDKGQYSIDSGVITLTGNVLVEQRTGSQTATIVSHKNTDSNGESARQNQTTELLMSLTTQALTYDSKTNFISTQEAVTIKRGLTSINAVGMEVDISKKKLVLRSQVRGRHVFGS